MIISFDVNEMVGALIQILILFEVSEFLFFRAKALKVRKN
jgi:hypothetical protein